jgi:hypothetical protein
MQIDRHAEALCPVEQRLESRVVEEGPVGPEGAAHQCADEAMVGDRPLQLVSGGGRVGGGQGGEAHEAVRMGANRGGELVVGLTRERHRLRGLQLLGRWRRVRDDL